MKLTLQRTKCIIKSERTKTEHNVPLCAAKLNQEVNIITQMQTYLSAKKPPSEHTSFRMTPETILFIKNCAKISRMTQGQCLQTIIAYYRLTRRKEALAARGEELTQDEISELKAVNYYLRILPY